MPRLTGREPGPAGSRHAASGGASLVLRRRHLDRGSRKDPTEDRRGRQVSDLSRTPPRSQCHCSPWLRRERPTRKRSRAPRHAGTWARQPSGGFPRWRDSCQETYALRAPGPTPDRAPSSTGQESIQLCIHLQSNLSRASCPLQALQPYPVSPNPRRRHREAASTQCLSALARGPALRSATTAPAQIGPAGPGSPERRPHGTRITMNRSVAQRATAHGRFRLSAAAARGEAARAYPDQTGRAPTPRSDRYEPRAQVPPAPARV